MCNSDASTKSATDTNNAGTSSNNTAGGSSQTYSANPLTQQAFGDIYSRAMQLSQTPYTPYGGQLIAGLNSTQKSGIQNVNNAQGMAQPYINQAAGYAATGAAPVNSVSSADIGQYLNPYQQSVINSTMANINETNAQQQQQVKGNAAAVGALGGDRRYVAQAELARQQDLASNQTLAGLNSQNYSQASQMALSQQQNQQANAQRAAQAAYTFGNLGTTAQGAALQGAQAQLQAGAVQQGTQQAQDTAAYQQYLQQLAFPYQQLGFASGMISPYLGALGGTQTGSYSGSQEGQNASTGHSTTTTTPPAPSAFSQIAGAAMTVAPLLMSDRRIKEGAHPIGKLYDGQTIYRFRFKGDPTTRVGLMAQNVERSNPHAVHEIGGIKAVDYDAATSDAAHRGHFAFGGRVGFADGGVPNFLSASGYVPLGFQIAPVQPYKFSPMSQPAMSSPSMAMPSMGGGQSPSASPGSIGGMSLGDMGKLGQAAKGLYDKYQPGSVDSNLAYGPGGDIIPASSYEEGAWRGGRINDNHHDDFIKIVHSIHHVLGRYADGGTPTEDAMPFDSRWAGITGDADPAPYAAINEIPFPRARPEMLPSERVAQGWDDANAAHDVMTRPAAVASPYTVIDADATGLGKPVQWDNPATVADAGGETDTPYAASLTSGRMPMSLAAPDGGTPPPPAPDKGGFNLAHFVGSKLGLSDTDARMAMLSAGAGIMSGRSPFGMVNIGAGLSGGIDTAQRARQLSDQAQRFAQQQAQQASQFQQTHDFHERQLAETARQHDLTINKPIAVQGALVKPSGEVVYKGIGLSDDAIEIGGRQLANGDMSPLTNVGRGAQGDQKITALRNKAVDVLVNDYGMSQKDAAAHMSKALQEFKAKGVGLGAEARTAGNREANLNLILKATDAAIPAALEASEKVARTGWVPVNQIIQKGQVIASNPDLKEFGMANLQLAEHWARAMNPTGVMRESDRDLALHFLSTADSPETYRRAVLQLQKQVTRERDAVRSERSGQSTTPTPSPAAAPATPPVEGAKQAKDGKWYVPDPSRPGKYLLVQ